MKKQIAANKRNTILIILSFMLFVGLIGYFYLFFTDDLTTFIIVLVIALAYALIQYFISGKLSLLMTGAKVVTKKSHPRYYQIVENLSLKANLPLPQIYLIDDLAPNAFATGRDPAHASVAVTTGLLDIMDDKELTAVLAHEISHIKNYDIRVSMITFGLVCIVGFIADLGIRMSLYGSRRSKSDDRSPVGFVFILIISIIAPIASSLAQFAISREREYLADVSAAKLIGQPDDMISALKKLDIHYQPMYRQNAATAHLYINNPLKKGFINRLFSTHPPIEKRIERLANVKK